MDHSRLDVASFWDSLSLLSLPLSLSRHWDSIRWYFLPFFSSPCTLARTGGLMMRGKSVGWHNVASPALCHPPVCQQGFLCVFVVPTEFAPLSERFAF